MIKTAIAIRHLAFEDIGCFEPVLRRASYKVHYHDIGLGEFWTRELVNSELVFVLGGPIAAYEEDKYPFLREEIDLLEQRLAAGRPPSGSVWAPS
jgi:GMP synthase (glutamine-hydrolysing)